METRLSNAGSNPCAGENTAAQNTCVHGSESPEAAARKLQQKKAETTPEDSPWMRASLITLIDHIRAKHHQYVRNAIPHLQNRLTKVRKKHGKNHPELARIEAIFLQIGQDMISHMQKEEQILFPYIEALEKSAQGNGTLERLFFQTVKNPIQVMMKEHESADDLCGKIRSETHGYAPPGDGCPSFQSLYQYLQEFDQDFHVHAHLEDAILFPRAAEMEATCRRDS